MSNSNGPIIPGSSPSSMPLPQQPGDFGVCEQCGAPLSPYLYFCSVCGRPYRGVESVTGRFVAYTPVGEEAICQKVPQVWNMFLMFVAVLFFSWIVTLSLGFSNNEEDQSFSLFVCEALLLGLTLFYAIRYWQTLKNQFNISGLMTRWFWICLGLLVPVLLINYIWHAFWILLFQSEDVNEHVELMNHFGPAMMVLLFCVLPGVLEEIAFRGLLQSWLMVALRPMSAILLASLLFAALHLSLMSMPVLFLVGLLLGFTHYKTRSLWPCMIIHFLHNLIVIFFFQY